MTVRNAMPATLTIHDETATGHKTNTFTLDCLTERLTVRELIRSRIYQEVQDYNLKTPEYFRGLVEPSEAEKTLNGYKLKKKRQIDWQEQFQRALESFERNGFFVLIGDRQAENLDEELEVKVDTDVSFVKLVLEPDSFPLLLSSELQSEHRKTSELIRSMGTSHNGSAVHCNPVLLEMCSGDSEQRTRYGFALIERIFAYDAKLAQREGFHHSGFFDYGPAAEAIGVLFDKGVEAERLAPVILEWFTIYRFNYYAAPLLQRAVEWIVKNYAVETVPDDIRQRLIALRGQLSDVDITVVNYSGGQPLEPLIDSLIGNGAWLVIQPCEVWTKNALADLENLSCSLKENWLNLLKYCQTAKSTRPSSKWLKTGKALLGSVGSEEFVAYFIKWAPDVAKGRVDPTLGMAWENVDERLRIHQVNANVLRGLLWLCPMVTSPELMRTVGTLAATSYRKVRGLGPRAVKVGNAAVYALSETGSIEAVGQLAILQAKIKFGSAQKEIEKAFNSSADRLGLPRDEIEEMAVPSYCLTDVGVAEEKMGEFTALLTVTGTNDTELAWIKGDGKVQRSVPASVKKDFGEDLKELQATAKDIQRILPAQRERLDSMFLQQRTWKFPIWRERYLDHPLVGFLARRLLWEFTKGPEKRTGIWFNGELMDLDLKAIKNLDEDWTVGLWHPIDKSTEEIVAWRTWFDAQQIQQPFKQAHREIYLLTDAEIRTGTYSNRYAAHVLKQHQFNALCALRGWKNKLRLMVDDEYPPTTLFLPKWNLRAEFWVEGIGQGYGNDTNESGVYLRLSTDQVRFYQIDALQRTAHAGGGGYHPGYRENDGEPLPLGQIPPLVFSEVMRDVDMFVGVASVGNDPAWADGGRDGRYSEYWQNYSFGALNASAKTRLDVLQRLVPRLKIAKQCSFDEKFLVVKGTIRTYKIHLGSGNILMEPNDQYLCIVPKQGTNDDGKVLLPFEGDRTLAVIISKAFLLAEDHKIKDTSILSQIKR